MATAAPSIAEVEVFQINPADVHVGARIGMFWPEEAAALGALMARDGQNDPVKVTLKDDRWQLVTGLHRLQGARGLGLQWIDAIEVKGSANDLRRIEASENVERRNLRPLERALFVRAMADLAEERWSGDHQGLSPQQIGQIKRWETWRAKAPGVVRAGDAAAFEADSSSAKLAGLYGWQEDVAESLGLSTRNLQRSLLLHRQLIAPFEPELWEALARTDLGNKQSALLEIAGIVDEDTRRLVIDTIVGDDIGEIKSVADAMVAAGAKARANKPRVTGDTKFMNNAGSNLSRLTASGWRSFAPTLAEMVKPSALIALRDALDARIAEIGDQVGVGTDD